MRSLLSLPAEVAKLRQSHASAIRSKNQFKTIQ
jgi:hypothetical protein